MLRLLLGLLRPSKPNKYEHATRMLFSYLTCDRSKHATKMPNTVSDTPRGMSNKIKKKFHVIVVPILFVGCLKEELNGLEKSKN